MRDNNVLPVSFDTSFGFFWPISSILALQNHYHLVENVLSFNLVCHMWKSVKNRLQKLAKYETTSKFNIVNVSTWQSCWQSEYRTHSHSGSDCCSLIRASSLSNWDPLGLQGFVKEFQPLVKWTSDSRDPLVHTVIHSLWRNKSSSLIIE